MFESKEVEAIDLAQVDLKLKAKGLPERYFAFLEARAEQESMAANLLTAKNLRDIKKYVNNVHELPRSLQDIRAEADYETLGVDIERVHDLYSALHRHVAEWEKLERKIKELGPEIELFAEGVKSRGSALLEHVEGSDVYQAVLAGQQTQGRDAVSAELTDEQRLQLSSLIEKDLQELIREIEETAARIAEVDKRADWFNREIDVELRPRLSRVLKHIKNKEGEVDFLKLEKDRDELDERIETLRKEYDANVGYAFTGMWWGPVGLIITGGIYGAKAESIRTKKNQLIVEYEEVSEKIIRYKPALLSVQKASRLIQSISTGTRDLKSAAQRLADVWLYLNKFASLSVGEAGQLSSAKEIQAFLADFAEVIRPWGKIKGVCGKLSKLFDQLLEEYENAE